MDRSAPEALRLFVALDLPAGHRAEIGERCRRLAAELPPARWVPAENLHLTLVFLGATDPAVVPALAAELREAAAEVGRPLRLELAGGGTFPPGRPARVAWIGVSGDRRLAPLREALVGVARDVLGLPPERRPFSAHVTVARPRRPWPRAASERFARAFARRLGEPFGLGEAILYRSRLEPGGARYTPLDRLPLVPPRTEDAKTAGATEEVER